MANSVEKKALCTDWSGSGSDAARLPTSKIPREDYCVRIASSKEAVCPFVINVYQ